MSKKVLLVLVLITFLFCDIPANAANPASKGIPSNRMEVDIQSKRVPAGTKLKIRIETDLNSRKSKNGDNFDSTIVQDIKVGGDIILPTGTALRGTIYDINKASLLSKGAEVLLSFDHIVTPVGKQVPVHAVITNYDNLTYLGAITSGSTYKGEVGKGFAKGKNIVSDTTSWGVDTGKSFWKGYPVVITAPLGAGAGIIGGTSYFIGKTIVSLFQKGENVLLSKGKILDIRLTQPLDIPVD